MAAGARLPEQVNITQVAKALGRDKSATSRRATRETWPFTERAVRGGRQRVYALRDLPADVQAALAVASTRRGRTPTEERSEEREQARIAGAWARFELATHDQRARAEAAAAALDAVAVLVADGHALMHARALVADSLFRQGRRVSVATLGRHAKNVAGVRRADWAPLLLPRYAGGQPSAECAPQLWDFYQGHYLTRGRPSHKETYRRCKEMADAQGWAIPSQRTLERRLDAEVSRATQVLLREGQEAARKLLPTVIRDVLELGAGEAVNGDGLKLDVIWVRFEDGEVLNSATVWFWQDIRTRRILAWRMDKTENSDLFRLATYDLTAVCAPTDYYIDNTRVAANKMMTAGAQGRHRFKTDPEDGQGLLLMIGGEPHFTNPSKEHGNPGAKPIERAFGIGGIHDLINSNPRLIAADCFRKANPASVELVREVIAEEVARFNARTQRRTQACRGVLSFDQAWTEGVAMQAPRTLSDTQRRLLLMAREVVTADSRNGELRLKAGRGPFGQNAYYAEHCAQIAGQRVAVHYDPADLHADVHVYDLDGAYLFAAQHLGRPGFKSVSAGREHGKFRRRIAKLHKDQAANVARMDALERAALYEAARPVPEAPEPAAPNVLRPVFNRAPDPDRDAAAAQRTGTNDTRVADLDAYIRAQAEQRLKDRL